MEVIRCWLLKMRTRGGLTSASPRTSEPSASYLAVSHYVFHRVMERHVRCDQFFDVVLQEVSFQAPAGHIRFSVLDGLGFGRAPTQGLGEQDIEEKQNVVPE